MLPLYIHFLNNKRKRPKRTKFAMGSSQWDILPAKFLSFDVTPSAHSF